MSIYVMHWSRRFDPRTFVVFPQSCWSLGYGGAHLCFMAFALHFQMLGQFSIFVKLSKQGVK